MKPHVQDKRIQALPRYRVSVWVVVSSVLALIGLGLYTDARCIRCNRALAINGSNILALSNALNDYAIVSNGKYPASLELLFETNSGQPKYFRANALPLYSWCRDYQYLPTGINAHEGPIVFTLGQDGIPGGVDADADISNLSLKGDPGPRLALPATIWPGRSTNPFTR